MVTDFREVQVVKRQPDGRIHLGGLGALPVASAAELIENFALRLGIRSGSCRCSDSGLRSCCDEWTETQRHCCRWTNQESKRQNSSASRDKSFRVHAPLRSPSLLVHCLPLRRRLSQRICGALVVAVRKSLTELKGAVALAGLEGPDKILSAEDIQDIDRRQMPETTRVFVGR